MRIIQFTVLFLGLLLTSGASAWSQQDSTAGVRLHDRLRLTGYGQTGCLGGKNYMLFAGGGGMAYQAQGTTLGLEATAQFYELFTTQFPRTGPNQKRSGGLSSPGAGESRINPYASGLGVNFSIRQRLGSSAFPLWIGGVAGLRADKITEYDRQSGGFFGPYYTSKDRLALGANLNLEAGYNFPLSASGYEIGPVVGVSMVHVQGYRSWLNLQFGARGSLRLSAI